MNMRNSTEHWGHVSQVFHWVIVVLVVVMAYLGLTMTDLPNGPDKIGVYALHKSIGMTILGLVALRLLWRLFDGTPDTLPGTPTWQARTATYTHIGLYALLVAVPLSGWVLNSAAGFPLHWFDLVKLPSIAAKSESLDSLAGQWHEFLFWALIVLSLVHTAAALYHHVFQRDATLARMLPRNWLQVRRDRE